jgi:acetolactate synthase-1/2/3 large subunit
MWGFSKANFAKIAEAMGCRGMRVEKPGELQPALKEALAANAPVVIDAVTDHRAFAQKTFI